MENFHEKKKIWASCLFRVMESLEIRGPCFLVLVPCVPCSSPLLTVSIYWSWYQLPLTFVLEPVTFLVMMRGEETASPNQESGLNRETWVRPKCPWVSRQNVEETISLWTQRLFIVSNLQTPCASGSPGTCLILLTYWSPFCFQIFGCSD